MRIQTVIMYIPVLYNVYRGSRRRWKTFFLAGALQVMKSARQLVLYIVSVPQYPLNLLN